MAAAAAIVAFGAMLALVTQAAPLAGEIPAGTALALGWFASRVDWIATAMLVGLGPVLLSVANRDWMPRWLVGWGYVAGVGGALSVAAMYLDGLTSWGFVSVPVGVLWTVAAGVTRLRR
jgi:hypothetical protein